MKNPILLVEDDIDLSRLVQNFLTRNGYSVVIESRGDRAEQLISTNNPQLIILDIMLPGIDGLTICRNVRPTYYGPILILTALCDDIDEVAGLETGADAYLAKPIQPRVLLAHIRALLRRKFDEPICVTREQQQQSDGNNMSLTRNDDTIQVGQLEISASRRTALFDNKPLQLTTGEFDTLWLLSKHAGKIVNRDVLYRHVRGMEHDGLDRTVDQHISKVRKKLHDNPRAPSIIKSIRGVGYILAK